MTEKKTFPLGKGTGKTDANVKSGPAKAKGAVPGHGYNNSGGDGKALSAGTKSKAHHHEGYKNSNGTGAALHGGGTSGSSSKAPGQGFSQGKGTGKALHGNAPHNKVEGEDGVSQGKGTGHALRGKSGGHQKAAHGGHSDKTGKGGTKGAAGKSTPSSKPAPYGLHDAPVKGMEGLRHYSKDASPKGIKNVTDLKAYAKKKYG